MKKKIALPAALMLLSTILFAGQSFDQREFYEIKVYHFRDSVQERKISNYLEKAYLPALHRLGIASIGVFGFAGNDTAADKRIYVIMPLKSLDQYSAIGWQLKADAIYQLDAADYINAVYKEPPYARIETILLKAFLFAPRMQKPALSSPPAQRVYELRSYESATEEILQNKISMFNEGGEIFLFKRLGFNAAFYAEVINGPKMPNLMYMTCFENKADRDQHWKRFGEDPEWKTLSARPEYQNNVSHIDIIFLRPMAYSDL